MSAAQPASRDRAEIYTRGGGQVGRAGQDQAGRRPPTSPRRPTRRRHGGRRPLASLFLPVDPRTRSTRAPAAGVLLFTTQRLDDWARARHCTVDRFYSSENDIAFIRNQQPGRKRRAAPHPPARTLSPQPANTLNVPRPQTSTSACSSATAPACRRKTQSGPSPARRCSQR